MTKIMIFLGVDRFMVENKIYFIVVFLFLKYWRVTCWECNAILEELIYF